MFFNEEQMKRREKEVMRVEAESELVDFLAQMMLESDIIPERDKLSVRVVQAAKQIGDVIRNHIVMKFAKPGEEADEETLKQVAEYLALAKTGLMQFSESTPIKREEN